MSLPKIKIKLAFPYYGNKRREIHHILKIMPKDLNLFVDVFGGTGIVCMSVDSKKKIYNEKNKILYDLMTVIKDKKKLDNMISFFNNNLTCAPDEYKQIIIDRTKTIDSAYECLYRYHYSYRIVTKCFTYRNGKAMKKRKYNFDMFSDMFNHFKNVEMTNLDFLDVIEKYKSDDTALLYLDPPYMSKSQKTSAYNDGGSNLTPFLVSSYIKLFSYLDDENVKCKLVYHTDFSGWIFDKYNSFIKSVHPKNYTGSNTDCRCLPRYQVLLANY